MNDQIQFFVTYKATQAYLCQNMPKLTSKSWGTLQNRYRNRSPQKLCQVLPILMSVTLQDTREHAKTKFLGKRTHFHATRIGQYGYERYEHEK